MARNWNREMELDENLTSEEKERFIEMVTLAGLPSIEEYADDHNFTRDEAEEIYWNKYGDRIRAIRDEATSEDVTPSNIRRARIIAGITQQKMCEMMGIPKRTISEWETGRRRPPEWAERLIVEELKSMGCSNAVSNYIDACVSFAKESQSWTELDPTKYYTTDGPRGYRWEETPDNPHGGLPVDWAFHVSVDIVRKTAANRWSQELKNFIEGQKTNIGDEDDAIEVLDAIIEYL